ncbi:related to FUN30-Protein important for chromosome integrity and segregation [Zygosaccharomyces bailii ISA1307]|nr:related to FUN30-Protein important for chromosome integrity and segregation [Zygosaccharomyces bailii ISA1307]
MNEQNDEVQVPESSSPNNAKLLSSSPLKQEQASSDTSTLLRDKFSFIPGNGNGRPSFEMQSSMPSNPETQLAQLASEFPDFSPTLVQAVFKSNSFNAKLARERLNRIRSQRQNWSVSSNKKKAHSMQQPFQQQQSAMTGRASPMSTNRLSSIKQNDSSSKITVERQKTSIFDRYSNVMNQKLRPTMTDSLVIDEESLAKLGIKSQEPLTTNKRRRLVRADNIDNRKPTQLDKAKENHMKMKKRGGLSDGDETAEEMSGEEEGSADEYEERTPEVNIDEQILHFLNTAEASDVADLGETSMEKANIIISNRPFSSLFAFSQMELLSEAEQEKKAQDAQKKRTRRVQPKKEGERVLEKINQSIRGYNAIDSLIKKCSTYGNLIASHMKRWGIDLEHANKDEELNFMSVDSDDDAVVEDFDENAVSATPTPVPDNGVSEATKKKSKRRGSDDDYDDDEDVDFEESEDEDEDYGQTRRSVTPHRRNRPSQRGLVKFFKGKPRLLSEDLELKDYQQTGINWLNLLYHNQMSCILADDMGLGKTCQVIAFIAYLKQINEPGPHLVVVPSSTLENWLREFQKFCPSLKIEPYYGSQQERANLREILERNAGQYDVVVTTYNLAAGNKYDISFLRNCNFNVVVYDEGHMLKNSLSERFSKLMRIQGNFRLLLTGTPLQNNLKELMSLLEFIMPSLFESKKEHLASIFKQRARTTDNNKDFNPLLAQEAINRAKTMMKPFILRRRKDQVLKHLPAKHRKVEMCELNSQQREIYEREIRLVMEHRQMVKDGVLPKDAKEKAKVQSSSSKNLIMALRKAALHPLLFRHLYNDEVIARMSDAILDEPEYSENGNRQYILEDMSYMTDFELHKLSCNFPDTLSKFQLSHDEWMQSGKIDKLCQLLNHIIVEKKEKVLIFSLFTQMLDILEMVLSTLKYKFLRLDGSTQVNDRQSLIDKFYEDDTIPVFILSTKAGGFGINLVCANNVVIFDQSFNPHDDRQAADRSHRVGQTKEVTITTLITRDSIEEKIFQLAKNKLDLDFHVSEDDKKAQDAIENKVSDILEDLIYDEAKE